MIDDEIKQKSLSKRKQGSRLIQLVKLPLTAKASIDLRIDRENAEARIKIIEADIIIKYGLLRGKRKGGPSE